MFLTGTRILQISVVWQIETISSQSILVNRNYFIQKVILSLLANQEWAIRSHVPWSRSVALPCSHRFLYHSRIVGNEVLAWLKQKESDPRSSPEGMDPPSPLRLSCWGGMGGRSIQWSGCHGRHGHLGLDTQHPYQKPRAYAHDARTQEPRAHACPWCHGAGDKEEDVKVTFTHMR